LWRLNRVGVETVSCSRHHVGLSPTVTVDVREVLRQTRTLLDGPDDLDTSHFSAPLSDELLPGWYDDWVVLERERLRQLRLHALESLAALHIRRRRFPEAIEAALAAVQGEPLRESAQRCLIDAHLAEENVVEAVRQYRAYCELLDRELGIAPSLSLQQVVESALAPIV
jgi:DNA-binding SARP family transcriptional activator